MTLCKKYRDWPDLIGQKITVERITTTCLGPVKALYEGKVIQVSKDKNIYVCVDDIKRVGAYFSKKNYDQSKFMRLVAFSRLENSVTVYFKSVKLVRINNTPIHGLFGTDISKWPLFALQGFYYREIYYKYKNNNKRKEHSNWIHELYSEKEILKLIKNLRNVPQKEIKNKETTMTKHLKILFEV